jgi:hypothetical protein
MSEIIDQWQQKQDGITWLVRLAPDQDSSPNDWTSETEDPELYATWRAGNWSFIGVTVMPMLGGDYPLDHFGASVWSVMYGQGPDWTVDNDTIKANYVSDLISQSRESIRNGASDLQKLIDAAP